MKIKISFSREGSAPFHKASTTVEGNYMSAFADSWEEAEERLTHKVKLFLESITAEPIPEDKEIDLDQEESHA